MESFETVVCICCFIASNLIFHFRKSHFKCCLLHGCFFTITEITALSRMYIENEQIANMNVGSGNEADIIIKCQVINVFILNPCNLKYL